MRLEAPGVGKPCAVVADLGEHPGTELDAEAGEAEEDLGVRVPGESLLHRPGQIVSSGASGLRRHLVPDQAGGAGQGRHQRGRGPGTAQTERAARSGGSQASAHAVLVSQGRHHTVARTIRRLLPGNRRMVRTDGPAVRAPRRLDRDGTGGSSAVRRPGHRTAEDPPDVRRARSRPAAARALIAGVLASAAGADREPVCSAPRAANSPGPAAS